MPNSLALQLKLLRYGMPLQKQVPGVVVSKGSLSHAVLLIQSLRSYGSNVHRHTFVFLFRRVLRWLYTYMRTRMANWIYPVI